MSGAANVLKTRKSRSAASLPEIEDAAERQSILQDKDAASATRDRRLRMVLKVLAITLALLATFLAGLWVGGYGDSGKGKSKSASSLTFAMHWRGTPVTLQKDGDREADVCQILFDCFKSPDYQPDPQGNPQNPFQTCHQTLRRILHHFDSGFLFDGPRVVGFASGVMENGIPYASAYSKLSVYNVCVRREERGRGLAKRLVSDLIAKTLEAKLPVRPPGHRVYVGLDVDFDTETPVAAFALYAKMGFVRWWEPCRSISYLNFDKLEAQHLRAHPSDSDSAPPTIAFPMSQYWLRRPETLANAPFFDSKKKRSFTHFCMVKLEIGDDFGAIASDIHSHVQAKLAEERQKQPS